MKKFLSWAIGLLIGLSIIGSYLWVFHKGGTVYATSQAKTVGIANESKNMELSEYDNTQVMGTDVVYAADMLSTRPQFSVQVVTKSTSFYATNNSAATQVCYTAASPSVTGTCGTAVSVSEMKDTTNSDYVNPSAVFSAKLYQDSTNNTRLVVFTQL